MPFIPAAAVAIGSAIAAGSATAAAVAAPTIASIASAAAAVGGTLYTVGKTVAHAVAGAAQVIGSVGSSAGGTIENILGVAGNVFKTFVDPVVKVFTEIKDFVSTINTNFIAPIREVYVGTLTAIDGLKSSLSADIHGGIAGLLKIPADISTQLGSLDASFARATQALGDNNAHIVEKSLVPGLSKGIGDHIDPITEAIVGLGASKYEGVGAEGRVNLNESLTVSSRRDQILKMMESGQNATGFFGALIQVFFDILDLLGGLEALQRPQNEEIMQAAFTDLPIKTLDLAETIEAYYRGIISKTDAEDEALRQGLSKNRLQTIIENRGWLPGLADLVWMVARGVIPNEEAVKIAGKLRLSETDWNAYFTAAHETPDPIAYRRAMARKTAIEDGWTPKSVADPVPTGFTELEQARRRDGNVAVQDWINSSEIPALEWWITRYLRGIGSEDDVYLAADARMIPKEIQKDLIPIFQRTIELWMIPDMIATGVIEGQEAVDYLKYIGIGSRDAELIVKYGGIKAKSATASMAADLAKISVTQAKDMFNAGTINENTYRGILIDHGFSNPAADLTISLDKTDQAIKERKAQATSIVDQVDLGVITEAQAVAELYQLNYTTGEVYVWVKKMKGAKVAKAKTLSQADLKDALMYGVINVTTWQQRMEQIGWQPADVAILYGIFVEQHGKPPNPG